MKKPIGIFFISLLFTGCSYNPLSANNHTTGSPWGAILGIGAGVGTMSYLKAPKPLITLMGVGGGMLGYYATTLRYEAGNIIQEGGDVYKVGDFVGIYIPTDKLFEPNTADFLPQASAILESAAEILQRYPNNNIMISGNTSGFARARWEVRISEERAKKVSAYLWNAGINQFKEPGTDIRRLTYVGYGDFFPIANNITNKGIRTNSRIQITSYPSYCDLGLDQRHIALNNFGADDEDIENAPDSRPCYGAECEKGLTL